MVVVGLGSPYLTDDSVGPRLVRRLAGELGPDIRLVEAHAGGLLLVEELVGADRAVIVDALVDPHRAPGEVVVDQLGKASNNLACSHDCTLPEALKLGRDLGMQLPVDDEVCLVTIVASDVSSFSESLTPAVEAALPEACAAVRNFLARRPA